MNTRGVIRDILLVSASSLTTLLVVHLLEQKEPNLQENVPLPKHTEGTNATIDEGVPQSDVSISDQLATLRMDMDKAHAALSGRIAQLDYQNQKPEAKPIGIEDLAKRLVSKSTYADRVGSLIEDEDLDQEASTQREEQIETHLRALGLNSSLVNGVDCYTSKCLMEFEHTTEQDENVFRKLVLYDTRGLFTQKYTYKTEQGKDGMFYTKVMLDR